VDLLHLPSILGGLLVGLAAATLLIGSGRIAGISGLLGGLIDGEPDRAFRIAFVGALLLVGVAAAIWAPSYVPSRPAGTLSLVIGGLLVGFGTRLGSGCTSGHGVCGVGRLSPRSMLSTAIFVGVGMLTVVAMRAVLGAP
jgi:uncharacterized membrane protein YedE/YeeE